MLNLLAKVDVSLDKSSENYCIFKGVLSSFRNGETNECKWGFGSLFLPSDENPNVGTYIDINAWGDMSEDLATLVGTWIKVLTVFNIEEYKGYKKPKFTVDCFIKIE